MEILLATPRRVPGGERPRRFGGAGTVVGGGVLARDAGARLGLSTYAARELMAHALDLSMRLPRLWGRVQALPETAVLPG